VSEVGDAVRSRSFGGAAREYDRFRPSPSPDALTWLLPPGARTAVDLGAGTGLVTRALADRVPHVVAVEPDDRMREVLTASVADRPDAGAVDAVAGTAEEIPLPDASVDVVVASSSWHWFDPDRAVPEIARVLRPGGVLGVLWSSADRRADWVAAVRDLAHADRDGSASVRRRSFEVELPPGSPFGPGESRQFERTAPMSRDDIAGMVCTYSGVLVLPPADRDDVRRRARALLDARPELGDADPVEVPFRTACWAAVRH
jgi:SAM-dependent methyltransferase